MIKTQNNLTKRQVLGAGVLFASTFLLGAVAAVEYKNTFAAADAQSASASTSVQGTEAPEIELEAQSAYVYDIAGGRVLFEKNADAQMPLASITKVMLALAVSDVLSPDENVVINLDALDREGDSGLLANEVWGAQDLIDFTLISSSNDGAEALSLAAEAQSGVSTVKKMNKIAQELNLHQTYFLDTTGLDMSETQPSAFGSAKDMASLFEHALEASPDTFSATARDGKLVELSGGFEHTAYNTNTALGDIPGLIMGKTGFTDLAGGNLGIVFDTGLGRPVVAVVLGSTKEGRFEDMKTLVNYTRQVLAK